MDITIHRGTRQIGGCITEIRSDSGTRILVDLGHNLPDADHHIDPLENKEKLQTLLEGIDGIVYTHNHGDHVGFYFEVPESIPQYIGEMSREVLRTQNLWKRAGRNNPSYRKLFRERLEAIDRMHTYHVAEEFRIGDISITPYLVNHSAADSYMLLIKCDGKTVLHTGDFRDHGFTGKGLFPTLEKYVVPQRVDVLITEGTMISRPEEKRIREYDVQKEMEAIMRKYQYVFLLCSSTNFDRIVAAHNAHTEADHGVFCCDRYQKDLFKTLAEYSGKQHPMFDIRDAEELSLGNKRLLDRMVEDGFTMLVRANSRFDTWMDLITRMVDPKRCILIYSQYPGYIDPEDPSYIKSLNEFIDSQRCEMITCHTTGHAYSETIAKVCEVINPTTAIIPIHKEIESDIGDILQEDLKEMVVDKDLSRNNINFIIR